MSHWNMQILFNEGVSGYLLPSLTDEGTNSSRYVMHKRKGTGSQELLLQLTRVLDDMAVCLEFLHGNLGTLGEKEDIPVLVPHRDRRSTKELAIGKGN